MKTIKNVFLALLGAAILLPAIFGGSKLQAAAAGQAETQPGQDRQKLDAEWKKISMSNEIIEPSAGMCADLEERRAAIERKSLDDLTNKERCYLVKCLRRGSPEKPLLVFRNRWVRHLQFGMTQEEIATPGVVLDRRWVFEGCTQSDFDESTYGQRVVRCKYWYQPHENTAIGGRVLQLAFDSDDRLGEWEYVEFFPMTSSSVLLSLQRKVTGLADLGLADSETTKRGAGMDWYFHSKTELDKYGTPKTLETVGVFCNTHGDGTAISITYHDNEALTVIYTDAHK